MLLAVTLTACKLQDETKSQEISTEEQLILIKTYVEQKLPEVNQADDTAHRAFLLRDYLFRSVPVQKTALYANFFNLWENFIFSVSEEDYGHICGGLSVTYATVLKAFGIANRHVAMFTTPTFPYDSHSTVEIWDGQKWIASDPSFNVSFLDKSGDYLSYAELRELTQNGETYFRTSNGFNIPPERDIANYYITLKELMNYTVIYPASTPLSSGDAVIVPAELLPITFDGIIRNSDGSETARLPHQYSVWNIVSEF